MGTVPATARGRSGRSWGVSVPSYPEQGGGEGLRGRAAGAAVAAGVAEGGAEGVVEDARACAAEVIEENEALRCLTGAVVVAVPGPSAGWYGAGVWCCAH